MWCGPCKSGPSRRGLRWRSNFAHALPSTIDCDPARLRQMLTNLIGNAIKFTERGRVEVILSLDKVAEIPVYRIDVKDCGIGIPADKLESVFEPFVQAEASTTRRFGGTGLGLTISRGFARAMGGDIVASSDYGHGTTFSVTLPAGDLDAVDNARPGIAERRAGCLADAAGGHPLGVPAGARAGGRRRGGKPPARASAARGGRITRDRSRKRPGGTRLHCSRRLRTGPDGHADAGDGRDDGDPAAARMRLQVADRGLDGQCDEGLRGRPARPAASMDS